MPWKTITLIAVVTLVLVTAAFSHSPTTIDDPMPDTAATATAPPHRIIGVWQGRVAVFAVGEDTPEQVYDTAVSSLPIAEQERLQKGVEAKDAPTLKALLDEYLS